MSAQKSLLDLAQDDCRFPIGGSGADLDHSYCAAHRKRAEAVVKPYGMAVLPASVMRKPISGNRLALLRQALRNVAARGAGMSALAKDRARVPDVSVPPLSGKPLAGPCSASALAEATPELRARVPARYPSARLTFANHAKPTKNLHQFVLPKADGWRVAEAAARHNVTAWHLAAALIRLALEDEALTARAARLPRTGQCRGLNGLTGAQNGVMYLIGLNQDKDGICRLTPLHLGVRLERGRETCLAAMKALEKRGLITLSRRRRAYFSRLTRAGRVLADELTGGAA